MKKKANASPQRKSGLMQLLVPLIAIAALVIFNLIRDPSFFSVAIATNNSGNTVLTGNLVSILNGASELAILSMGMTLVTAACGGQDISVGALAGMFFARGMTTIISINPQKVTHEGFQALMNARIEIPWLGYVARNGNRIPARMELGVVVALLIVVLVFIMLRKSRLGRNFYAIGGNSQSALMLGINVQRTRFIAHLLSSVLAGIAGFVFMMHTGAGNVSNAQGMEMDAIASAIIGGTLLSGGVGNIFGTLFGVLTLATIKAIVTAARLNDPWWQSITTGAMLCFFILLQSVVLSMRGKRTTTRATTK